MANEFTISIQLHVVDSYFEDSIRESFQDDMLITGMGGGVQLIGTTAETITLGPDLQYEGWLYLQNLDADNTIDWGPDNVGAATPDLAFILKPGKAILVYLKPGQTFKAQARTAASWLYVKCYDSTTGT